ncbi:MAG: hypothetical protein KZQ66_08990 [Candidatus Thiodiazotropha sp. (ex Lucinoma aequizonata)]|nr:hypothetical protein [Candidatus Thiodiazotropha sp. (ex Lucinoma aequizonata)]MCU7902109.1 hypothetical protein [Candidatus Thiodiazotropha sp. (ex Lucinoma aequizonata)]MCU7910408.1 hypothetical protein [Candidatus Thiodiazotropha sp. (ex Lucinoma aequizonata)]MCU7913842.1 hypothetical protein [Candidatus Thiodiazotropha sp. (ex Lucinoma aequizonata)]
MVDLLLRSIKTTIHWRDAPMRKNNVVKLIGRDTIADRHGKRSEGG